MSVRLKQYDEKRWEVDVGVRLSSGQRYRERRLLLSNGRNWIDAMLNPFVPLTKARAAFHDFDAFEVTSPKSGHPTESSPPFCDRAGYPAPETPRPCHPRPVFLLTTMG